MNRTAFVENLESRTLLSVAPITHVAPSRQAGGSRIAVIHRPTARRHLRGSATGSYTTPLVNPDVGHEYDIMGSGTISPVGATTVAGRINTPGNVARGSAIGQITLSGPHGALTLSVHGPIEPGFGPLPARLAFTIASGTGTYLGARGSGHVTIHLNSTAKTFVVQFEA